MTSKNLENSNKFLDLLKKENYTLQEDFKYQSRRQKVSIKHNNCGTIFSPTVENFLFKNSRCPHPKCISKKREKTNLEKYGCANPFQNMEIREKIKQTNLKKYGVEHPQQNEEIRKKSILTNIEKYGVENISQSKEIIEKRKQTNLKRYGVDNPLKSEKIQQKRKQTILKKYGVEHHFQNKEVIEKRRLRWVGKYNEEFPIRNEEIRNKIVLSKRNNFYRNIISKFEQYYNIRPLFTIDEYSGINNIEYNFKCLKCKNDFSQRLDGTKPLPICRKCNPINYRESESNFQDFIEEKITIKRNKFFFYENGKRQYELDVYIPELNIGFEFDGIYWHSEISGGKGKFYHVNKNKFFEKKGIFVFRVWENEWNDRQEIVKSIILNKINRSPNKVYARKLKIRKLDNKNYKEFMDKNHVQGYCTAGHRIGLCDDVGEVFCCLSLSKSRFNKNYEYEIVRFANKLNHSVVGGFSKLFKNFVQENKPKSIVSYADKRYSDGNLYEKNGFIFMQTSQPNYFYTKDYRLLESRIRYQKHKLSKNLDCYNGSMTEWENMKNTGYDRIWDCGNLVYVWKSN